MRIIIKAVPERGGCVKYLRERLPNAEWCFDRHRDAWETFLRAMSMAGGDAHLAMEEDVLLTVGFLGKVAEVVRQRPNEVIQFFSMRGEDTITGSRYSSNFCMNQCTHYPNGYASAIVEFAGRWERRAEHPTGTDLMVNDFLKSRKEKHWIHIPNLVDHLSLQSAIGGRSRGRQSKTFKDPWL